MKFYRIMGSRFDTEEFYTSKREAIARAKEVGGIVTVHRVITPHASQRLVLAVLNGEGYATEQTVVFELEDRDAR